MRRTERVVLLPALEFLFSRFSQKVNHAHPFASISHNFLDLPVETLGDTHLDLFEPDAALGRPGHGSRMQ